MVLSRIFSNKHPFESEYITLEEYAYPFLHFISLNTLFSSGPAFAETLHSPENMYEIFTVYRYAQLRA